MHADPPAWIFPVQACNSNHITLKQIQIIDTLVAKFRKFHDATPQHDTFKTPGQASPNPSNFGDTWKYLCTNLYELEDYVQYLCVVKSVHLALQMTCLHLWLCVA